MEKVYTVSKNFDHQKTIGIIGATPDAHAFILKANQLGFNTIQLCKSDKEAETWCGADSTFVGNLTDHVIQDEFLMKCDILLYFDYTITASQLEEAQRSVFIPQGEDVLSIARDLALQKAFKESLSVNIAPYYTVVKPEDIESGIRSIGYPAVMRTNYLDSENKDQEYFIYEETDIEKAEKLLNQGTCVLESWIVTDQALAVSVVKTTSGQIEPFSIVKRVYRNNRLASIQEPVDLDPEISEEVNRVAILLAENIEFTGVITVDFIISPAQAIYVGDIYPFPTIRSRYAETAEPLSITEAHLRATTSLPISENLQQNNTKNIFIPFYIEQAEVIDDLLRIYPDWDFTFYPTAKAADPSPNKAIGHIIAESENIDKVVKTLRDYDF